MADRQWEAAIQYYFKVDPDDLSDYKFELYKVRLKYMMKKTGQWEK